MPGRVPTSKRNDLMSGMFRIRRRTGPQSSVDCSSLRTSEAADVAQVDARDVLDVRQVLRQRELAAVVQIDAVLAVLRANVADHANDRAGEDAYVEDEK